MQASAYNAVILITLLIIFSNPALAFTDGRLLPRYLCSPTTDGLPKTLGSVLQYTTMNKNTPLSINKDATNNIDTKTSINGIPNTAYLLASFHNSLNSIDDQTPNVISITSQSALTPETKSLPLTLSSRNGTSLSGCMIYAQDEQGTRIGSFADSGSVFSEFLGCGVDSLGRAFGVVQNQIVSASGVYGGLVWNVPEGGLEVGKVVLFKGLGVDGVGFGVFEVKLVVGAVGQGASASSTVQQNIASSSLVSSFVTATGTLGIQATPAVDGTSLSVTPTAPVPTILRTTNDVTSISLSAAISAKTTITASAADTVSIIPSQAAVSTTLASSTTTTIVSTSSAAIISTGILTVAGGVASSSIQVLENPTTFLSPTPSISTYEKVQKNRK
ncbi:UNVERIFIED_CONTAM: hypothetical protein HDU68_009451 [Siphonaria sp. JEL0065]|nr:hypothetical protein HDU68_009451 [Siphonaria sp. JEL0065]